MNTTTKIRAALVRQAVAAVLMLAVPPVLAPFLPGRFVINLLFVAPALVGAVAAVVLAVGLVWDLVRARRAGATIGLGDAVRLAQLDQADEAGRVGVGEVR